jgi:hypothetical protein
MSLYVYAAVAIGAAAAAAGGTWKVQDWRYGAKEAARLEAVHRDMRAAEKRVDTAAAEHEGDKREIIVQWKTITKEVDRVVEKPVYRDMCLDDDGMRVLREAIAPTPASEPPGAVPGPSPTD